MTREQIKQRFEASAIDWLCASCGASGTETRVDAIREAHAASGSCYEFRYCLRIGPVITTPENEKWEEAMTTPVEPRLSLYQIESELAELVEFRESCETDEERKVADTQILAYVEREVRKVDGIRSYLKHCEMMAAAAKEEATLQSGRARAWQNRVDGLKDAVLGVMQLRELKKLEGRTGFLMVKGNGGLQKLDITDETLVPPQYCEVTVTMSVADWLFAQAEFLKRGVGVGNMIATRQVKTDLVRKALSEPCPVCNGDLQIEEIAPAEVVAGIGEVSAMRVWTPCQACGGDGKKRVPGARLEPRNVHLEVK